MTNRDDSAEAPASVPSDTEAEKTVLRAVLLSADALADILEEFLQPGDFYRPAHALIYEAALQVYAEGERPDAPRVSAALAAAGKLEAAGGESFLSLSRPKARGRDGTAPLTGCRPSPFCAVPRAAAHVESLASEGIPDDVDRIADIAQAEMLAATVRSREGLPPAYSAR